MEIIRVIVRLEKKVAEVLRAFCKENGLLINQDSIIEKLEELSDTYGKLRKEKTRPFNEALSELK